MGLQRFRVVILAVMVGTLSALIAVGGMAGAAQRATTQPFHVATTTMARVSGGGHKEGGLAVFFSFVGLIAIIVLLVFLGSLSARRRSRKGLPDKGPREPRPGRGLLG
jgi:hypothetical protein